MAVATVLPFVARPAPARVEPVMALPPPAAELEPAPAVEEIDADEAIEAFVLEMAGWAGGNEFSFASIAKSYEQVRTKRGWPEVSTKLLGLRLARYGCVRMIRDNRPKGGGKVVCYRFPLLDDVGAVVDPMEIAA